tara:strand:- start:929 stop:1213 length:285 start_codon:yes stop_codon:yes gene_type:complete
MNELPNNAYYVRPIYTDQLDKGERVPVIIVQKDLEGFSWTSIHVSSWDELGGLNDDIGCDNVDAYVLQSLSMFPYGNIEKLYQAGKLLHCNILL